MVLLTFTAVRRDPAAFFAENKNPPSRASLPSEGDESPAGFEPDPLPPDRRRTIISILGCSRCLPRCPQAHSNLRFQLSAPPCGGCRARPDLNWRGDPPLKDKDFVSEYSRVYPNRKRAAFANCEAFGN